MTNFTESHTGVPYLLLGDAQHSLQASQGCSPHSQGIVLLQLIRRV